MKRIRLALDWTPSVVHAGFFYALHKGWYDEADLDVEFIYPAFDGYNMTPARRLAKQKVDFAISSSESIIAYVTTTRKIPTIVSVATIFQQDPSAVATLRESGLGRPSILDGRRYLSYGFKYEEDMLRMLIRNDGGNGEFDSFDREKPQIWDEFIKGEADATWIYQPWEGVKAAHNNVNLNIFPLRKYHVPYAYSHLLMCHVKQLPRKKVVFKKFMEVSEKAFREICEQPESAAAFLCNVIDHDDWNDVEFITKSINAAKGFYFGENNEWGTMNRSVWKKYMDWLVANKILTLSKPLDDSKLFNNQLFD
ncbi:MAG: ABC transporter substrate-binding protein [Balneolales bacterium]|nr:ABC transporter substrate-binding protein [Balneolales bacterium]